MGINEYNKEKYDDYKKYKNRLSGEYKTIFEKIDLYITDNTKLNIIEKNNCFLQILDTFLSAQEEGRGVEEIIGSNLMKYCDDMIRGEAIYIYKISRVCFKLLGVLSYIIFMNFFMNIGSYIELKDTGLIFKSINFGIAEVIFAVMCVFIPKFTALVTRNHFNNINGYRKIRRYARCIEFLFIPIVYTIFKINFKMYGINIYFTNAILIFIYTTIISVVVDLLTETFNKNNDSSELLNKQYEKYKARCEKCNKNPLEWNDYLKKKYKDNRLFIIIFSLYLIIFLALAFLIARGMLVDGKLEFIAITILIIISFLFVVIISVIRTWIIENRAIKF